VVKCRVNKGRLPRASKASASQTSADANGTAAAPSSVSPNKATTKTAKQKAADGSKAASGKVAKQGKADKPVAGRKKKQSAVQESNGEAEDIEAVIKPAKPGRKGKQLPPEQTDGQKRRAAAAPAKGPAKAQKQQLGKCTNQAASASDSKQPTDIAAPSSPVSKGHAKLARRGRKALSDNGAEQDDDGPTTSETAATAVVKSPAVASPKGKRNGVDKEDETAAPKGRKAVPKGQKAEGKGQRKAPPAAKPRQASKRQQPR